MTTPAPGLLRAIGEWRAAIGEAHVRTEPAELARAATATFATSQRISAILRPASRSEVQAVARIASRHQTPIHPVSSGKNWGFGSRVPTADGAALLELSRMNRITSFDEELAYVTVEPGVSFRQLYDFLRDRGSTLFVASTGASPDASIVGNALERGDGSGPYGDRIQHVCGLEVVLATGECLHTGFARFAGTPLAPLHRYGVGPALDGLFAQSSLGIVTELTAWLSPLPRALAAVRFSIRDPVRLAGVIDAIRRLRLDGTLCSVAGIWNDYRVLSTQSAYPWQLVGDDGVLSRQKLESLSAAWGGASWFGLLALYAASPEQGAAQRAHVERVLGPAVDELSIEARSGEPRSGSELFHEHDPGFQFLQGIPHEGSLRSVYWRKRAGAPEQALDPDRDRCGVVWSCPTLPLTGSAVERAVLSAERILLAHAIDPLLAMVVQSERTAYLIPLIVYDRDEPGADARALSAHDAVLAALAGEGFLPYRLGIQSMDALPAPRDDFAAVHRRLKRALDPADVLAPGRYDFRKDWPGSER
jgi:4-cresol dehydrogenase (hydroxylating) flavoprotein subunit